MRTTFLAALLLCAATAAFAAESPQYASDRHEGVVTCRNQSCHGAQKPGKQPVLQTEYEVWKAGAGDVHHAVAYRALHSKQSKRIARNLGLAQPAHEADLCLDCHADNVPKKYRGARFKIDQGVSCEACHGGSERWLKPHDSGLPHAENLKLGLFPTDDPVARAELCLSCHFGDRRKFVDHRLMGAGHPRQSFELFLFTFLQQHHEIDADFEKRGTVVKSELVEWAVGQAVTVREILDAMLDPKRNHHGIWPEFVLFDCHACHHPMSKQRWRPRESAGLGPGLARLNDADFLMLRQALQIVDPPSATKLSRELRALHGATAAGRGDDEPIARRTKALVESTIPKLLAWRPKKGELRTLMGALVAEGASGEYYDYAGAEQATIALQILVSVRWDDLPRAGRLASLLAPVRVRERRFGQRAVEERAELGPAVAPLELHHEQVVRPLGEVVEHELVVGLVALEVAGLVAGGMCGVRAVDPLAHRRVERVEVARHARDPAFRGAPRQDEAAARAELVELAEEDRPGVVLERVVAPELATRERALSDRGVARAERAERAADPVAERLERRAERGLAGPFISD